MPGALNHVTIMIKNKSYSQLKSNKNGGGGVSMKTSNHSSSDSERSDMSDISESEFGLIFISSFSTATSIIRSLL